MAAAVKSAACSARNVASGRAQRIEVITRGQVRRAKLYYLRKLRGKAARIKERKYIAV